MKSFLFPTKLKVLMFGVLLVYVLLSVVFLASLNCSRCSPEQHQALKERVELLKPLIFISIPGIFLATPFIYTSDHLFTQQTSVQDLLMASGMVDTGFTNENPQLNQPISGPTTASYAAATLVELLFLYVLVCLIAIPFQQKRLMVSSTPHLNQ